MNISNSFRNPLIAHDYANTADNNAVTVGVFMILAEAFTKDWHLAKSEPIEDFYLKLLKYRKMLNLDEQQIKEQFLRDLSLDLENDVECIGTEQLLADLFEILEQIKMQRAEKKLELISEKVSEFVPIFKSDLPSKPVIKKVEVDSDNKLANLMKKQLKLHVAKAVKKAMKAQYSKSESKSNIKIHISEKVVLNMLDSIASIDWIEKLKAKIGTNMLAHVKSLFTSALSIQKTNFSETGSVKNYKKPAPEIPNSDDKFIDDLIKIDFV
ncbi:3406_t:CDS:2 [Cetraspora pellucida]|uniref:3406_t:CDS:1 n=1 Tax=Cetraspora pellucida TaxID=1433469 RepID=A0A9N8ZBN0_9GLOM|nr:3406_t:CDS:2 [Cetraspora pellucida]